MAKSPSEVLCKPKSMDAKKGKSDEDKDDKGPKRRSALIDFIAKHKQGSDDKKAGGKAY